MSKFSLAVLIGSVFMAPAAFAQTSAAFDVGAALRGNAAGMNADGSIRATVVATTAPQKEVMIRTAADVVTEDDLNLYENNISMTNKRVTDADSSKAKVAVSYEHEGRLLGIIPIAMETRTTASISDDGTLVVKTTIPWWKFLVMGMGDIRTDVDNELAASADLLQQVYASDDATARARALDTIVAAHVRAEAGK